MLALASIDGGVRAVAVAMVLTPFLFDSAYRLCGRVFHGQRIWWPHRTRFYRRVLIVGKSHGVLSGTLAVSYNGSGAQGRLARVAASIVVACVAVAGASSGAPRSESGCSPLRG